MPGGWPKVFLKSSRAIVKSAPSSWDDVLRETFPARGAKNYNTFSVELLSKLQALKEDSSSQAEFERVDALVFLASYTKNFLAVGYGPYLWHGEGKAVLKLGDKDIGMLLPDSVLFGEDYLPVKFSSHAGEVELSFWHVAAASCDEILMSRAVRKASEAGKLGELLTYEVGMYKASFLHYLFTSTRITYKKVIGFLGKLAEAINSSVDLSDADASLSKQHDPIFAGESALGDIVALFTGSECTRHFAYHEDAPGLLQYILAREQLYKWKTGKLVGESMLHGGKGMLTTVGKLMKVVGKNSGFSSEQMDTALRSMQDEFDGYKDMWNHGTLSHDYGKWSREAFEGGTAALFAADDDIDFLLHPQLHRSSDSSDFAES